MGSFLDAPGWMRVESLSLSDDDPVFRSGRCSDVTFAEFPASVGCAADLESVASSVSLVKDAGCGSMDFFDSARLHGNHEE